jgi:hypothetical protein
MRSTRQAWRARPVTSGADSPGLPARIGIAVALLAVGGVHLNLYAREEYNKIPTIGWLFLLTAISSLVLAVLIVIRPSLLALVASAGFGFGVLTGYLLSLYLPNGLFLFKELGISYSGGVSIAGEVIVVFGCCASIFRRSNLRIA